MKFITKGLGFILVGALFIVTISCTIDLLSQILPAKYWYLPVLGASAFDVGVIVWVLTLLNDVENTEQRAICWTLLCIDIAGVGVTAISDVFFVDAARGLVTAVPHDWIRYIVAGVMLIIIINVIGWLGMHIVHPKHIAQATGKGMQTVQPQNYVTGTIVTPQPQQQPPALPRPKQGLLGTVKSVLWGEQQDSPPARQVDPRTTQQDLQDWVSTWMGSTDQQNGMPLLEWLEEMGSEFVRADTMALARRLYPVKAASPLQQPMLDTTNGNGRVPK